MRKRKLKIGILLSGSGSNAGAIMDACESERIDGVVTFVGSDVPDVYGLQRAKNRNIPDFVVDYKSLGRTDKADMFDFVFDRLGSAGIPNIMDKKTSSIIPLSIKEADKMTKWIVRRIFCELHLLDAISQYEFDLLALAGFMRNLSAFFIDRINTDPEKPRITNIHPALLPSFPGTNGYEDTFNYGCKIGGSTVHFVDYGEDTGPIIGQAVVPIFADDTLENFKKRGLAAEWQLYPKCIQFFAEDQLRVIDGANGRKIVRRRTT